MRHHECSQSTASSPALGCESAELRAQQCNSSAHRQTYVRSFRKASEGVTAFSCKCDSRPGKNDTLKTKTLENRGLAVEDTCIISPILPFYMRRCQGFLEYQRNSKESCQHEEHFGIQVRDGLGLNDNPSICRGSGKGAMSPCTTEMYPDVDSENPLVPPQILCSGRATFNTAGQHNCQQWQTTHTLHSCGILAWHTLECPGKSSGEHICCVWGCRNPSFSKGDGGRVDASLLLPTLHWPPLQELGRGPGPSWRSVCRPSSTRRIVRQLPNSLGSLLWGTLHLTGLFGVLETEK